MKPKTSTVPHKRPGGAAAGTVMNIAGVEVELVRKRVKRLSLRVYPPDGRVRLTAPMGARGRELEELVRERSGWIEEHQRRFRRLSAAGAATYEAGETHYLRGRPYALRREATVGRAAPSVALVEGQLVLRAPDAATPEAALRAFDACHRRVLAADVPPLLERWQARLGREVSALGVKRMATRWGSCNPAAGRVWLNLELARRRPELLEYVLVHELAHLFVADHGPRFKALMGELLPGWRTLGAELDAWPLWARLPPESAN